MAKFLFKLNLGSKQDNPLYLLIHEILKVITFGLDEKNEVLEDLNRTF